MNEPTLWSADGLKVYNVSVDIGESTWVAARPLNLGRLSIRKRLRLAWKVFTGQYDAVFWYKKEG